MENYHFYLKIVLQMLAESNTLTKIINVDEDDNESFTEPKEKVIKIENYVSRIVPHYNDKTFQSHFRICRTTFDVLLRHILDGGYLQLQAKGKEQVEPRVALLLTLWYLANEETYRQISDRFNVSVSTAHKVLADILNIIINLKNKYIKWPNSEEADLICAKFEQKCGMPLVIGAIDGCHIPINKPNNEFGNSYINRKGFPSLLLQAVVLPDKVFSDVYCGEPGSLHDARLLRRSSLFRKAQNQNFFNDKVLIGDSAYPNNNWLITPFKDNGLLTDNQKYFNFCLSSTRIVVEQAFGILKGRFRRLHHINNLDLVLCSKIIMAACVLHNVCLSFNDDTVILLSQDDAACTVPDYLYTPHQTNTSKRALIYEHMCRNKINEE